jgi:hypothetical protein
VSVQRGGTLLTGGLGFLMVLCCLAGPAVIGAVSGTAVGGTLGIAATVAIALVAAALLRVRGRRNGPVC